MLDIDPSRLFDLERQQREVTAGYDSTFAEFQKAKQEIGRLRQELSNAQDANRQLVPAIEKQIAERQPTVDRLAARLRQLEAKRTPLVTLVQRCRDYAAERQRPTLEGVR